MKTNPILREIRETRDQLAEEAGYDLRRLFKMARVIQDAAEARGEIIVRKSAKSVVGRNGPK
jgi:hypothetical protein